MTVSRDAYEEMRFQLDKLEEENLGLKEALQIADGIIRFCEGRIEALKRQGELLRQQLDQDDV